MPDKFLKIDGFEVQWWVSDYERRTDESVVIQNWTYSQGQILF